MRIVVVGGGIAGLSAALRLRDRLANESGPVAAAPEIVLVDRSDQVGGKLRTSDFAGVPTETGAETFLTREHGAESAVLALARRVGLGDELVHPAQVGAAIAVGGALRPMPAGTLLGVPADPASVAGLALITGDDPDTGAPLLGPGQDVAVGALVRQRFGPEVVDRLVDPLLGGVYAGRADRLSMAATVPGLHRAAQHEHTLRAAVRSALAASPRPTGSPVFASVRGGLSRLVAAVASASGASVRLGSPVRELCRTADGWRLVLGSTHDPEELRADAVILAVPAFPAARLLRGAGPGGEQSAAEVAALDYASVALVTMALPAGTELPDLSGFLVPASEGYAVKAATFFTTKWPHLREPGGPVLVRASLGRYCEERVLQRTDTDLAALAREDLSTLLGRGLPEPLAVRVNRWGGGLPQYEVGHVDRVVRARAALPPTLALAGAAYDGVGIAACVRSGENAADAVVKALGD